MDSKTGTATSQAEVFRKNPHTLRGRKLFYGSSVGTEPLFADVIVDQAVQWNLSWRRTCNSERGRNNGNIYEQSIDG
jgi:hypothetical protein